MKELGLLWSVPLIAVLLGCTSRHGNEESQKASHSEEMRIDRPAEPRSIVVFGFQQDTVGALPPGWKAEGTNQEGPIATWKVIADETAPGAPNVLALIGPNHDSSGTFNLCWTDKVRFRDGSIEVAMKPVSGKEDQGGGLIWRAKDKDNYYVCRANPLESNFRVYYVKDASRHELASASVEIAAGAWHTVRVEHRGERITCTLDGKKLLEVGDSTFPDEGGVGLWTKADAASEFDDLRVTD